MRSLPAHLQLKNFNTNQEALERLQIIEDNMHIILEHTDIMRTSRIMHDEPEVWRLSWQLGEVRLAFHKIFPCHECFFHPHPWPSLVKCLKGGYIHQIGIYNGAKEDVMTIRSETIEVFSNNLIPMRTMVSSGDIYIMTDIRHFHQVSTNQCSYSLMIMGEQYFQGASKQFSRITPKQNILLEEEQIQDILTVIHQQY